MRSEARHAHWCLNLYTDEAGNAQLPKKFQALKKRGTRVRWTAIAGALLALAVIVGGIAMFSRYRVIDAGCAGKKHRGHAF